MEKSIFKYFYSFRCIPSKSDSVCQLFVLNKHYNSYNKFPKSIDNLPLGQFNRDFYSWEFNGTRFARLEWSYHRDRDDNRNPKFEGFTYKVWGSDLIIFILHQVPLAFELEILISPKMGKQAKGIFHYVLSNKFHNELADIRKKADLGVNMKTNK